MFIISQPSRPRGAASRARALGIGLAVRHTSEFRPERERDVYDRASIESFLETHDTSPLTNEPLATKSLTPNDALRSRLRERATLL